MIGAFDVLDPPTPRPRRARRRLASLLVAGALAPAAAPAEEWSFVGARYQGMGGAGVAVVDDEHASYWNPGALAFTPSGYGVSIPVGGYAGAQGSALSNIDRVADYVDEIDGGELDQLLSDLDAGNPITPALAGTALRLGAQELPGLDTRGEGLAVGLDASLLLRWRRFAVTGIGQSHVAADPVFDRANLSMSAQTGANAVDSLIDPGLSMDRYAPTEAPDVVARLEALFVTAGSTAPNAQAEELVHQAEQAGVRVRDPRVAQNIVDVVEQTIATPHATFADNQSGTFVRGLAVEQIGFGYGHPFLGERIGIGGNVKYIIGTTFNRYLRYDSIDGPGDITDAITDSDRREVTHTASLDLGVMLRPWKWLRFGVTARDVTKPEFDLARDPSRPGGRNKLALDPQVRAGAALWILPNWVVAFDADLTENESNLIDGYASRIVSLGTEWKLPLAMVGLAFRGGAYWNAAEDDVADVALTAGIGLRVADFNLDLAVGASPKTERVAAADDQRIPSRANASLTLGFRRTF
ncbi:MAG: conjugal transfer protein TraF [Myxococcota bacterium]